MAKMYGFIPYDLSKSSLQELRECYDKLKAEEKKMQDEIASYGSWSDCLAVRDLKRELQRCGSLIMAVFHEINKRTTLDYDV